MITLIIVNVQSDFVTGTTSFKGARNVLDSIKKFIRNHKKEIEKILFVCDWHPYNHCSFKRYGGTMPSHCVQFTPGACIEPKLLKYIQSLEYDYEVCLIGQIEEVEEEGAFSEIEVVEDELGVRIYLDCIASCRYPTDFVMCGIWDGVRASTINMLEDGTVKPLMYVAGIVSKDGGQSVSKFIKENKLEKIH